MPYILQKHRKRCEHVLKIMKRENIQPEGDLNYILYAFCKRNVKPSYNNYKNFLGELTECCAEIRRRLLAPYEDKKIKENGDVF